MLAALIDPKKRVPLPPAPTPGSHTVLVTVVDRDRTAVTMINSLYSAFGVAIATEQTGILLHNRGSCFVVDPAHPNTIDPGKRPRMVAVQSAGCAPVARAFSSGEKVSQMWQNEETFASGLRVPKPYGDYIMLEILKESGGVALSFPDEQILASLKDWAKNEGIFLSPEGAASTVAYDHLLKTGYLKPEDRVVLFNTGSGLKYTDVTAGAAGLKRPS